MWRFSGLTSTGRTHQRSAATTVACHVRDLLTPISHHLVLSPGLMTGALEEATRRTVAGLPHEELNVSPEMVAQVGPLVAEIEKLLDTVTNRYKEALD